MFSKHKETIELWQYLRICSYNCECHAQTGTCMMWLQSSGTQWPQSPNEKESFLKWRQLFHLYAAGVSFRQTKQKVFLQVYLKGPIIMPISIPHPISGNMCNKTHSWAIVPRCETNLFSILWPYPAPDFPRHLKQPNKSKHHSVCSLIWSLMWNGFGALHHREIVTQLLIICT